MTKPIEGWVAWHPDGDMCGFDVCDSIGDAEYALLEGRADYEAVRDNELAVHEKLRQEGWRIRPVRITFTDEETPEQRKERVCNMSRAELEEALNELSVEPIALTQAATSCTTPVYVQSSIGNETIEDGVEDNEFNRGLKAMADYVESLAPELNGYIEFDRKGE